jgi:hypothetical protein
MVNQLKDISFKLDDNIIVVGGVARFLNGYTETYEKDMVDVVIPPTEIESLKRLGRLNKLTGPTNFPSPIIERYGFKKDQLRMDVFVRETKDVEYQIIQDLKVATPQHDLKFVKEMKTFYENDFWENKLDRLEDLYGIHI